MPATADRLFVACQRLLPARLLGATVHRLAAIRQPWLKDWQIRTFVRTYGIDTGEAALPVPAGYPTLNAFFTRALQAGARPVDPDPAAITSPADGRVEEAGRVSAGLIFQAKGHSYSLGTLLASDDPAEMAAYEGGTFATIYLAPHDYHRVHMPLAGEIRRVVHVPGRRLAVNPRTVAAVPGLFAANERVVCHAHHAGQPFAVVLVGALNVASISLAFAGTVTGGRTPTRILPGPGAPAPVALAKGDLLGQFNLGSTVVLALGAGLAATWLPELRPGAVVRVGRRVGSLGPAG